MKALVYMFSIVADAFFWPEVWVATVTTDKSAVVQLFAAAMALSSILILIDTAVAVFRRDRPS